MRIDRSRVLVTLLVGSLWLGAGCSTDDEVRSDESADLADEHWQVVPQPSDPVVGDFPRLIAPGDAALPCRVESSGGRSLYLEYNDRGLRSRIVVEHPPDTPDLPGLHDTVHTYSYGEDGELTKIRISPLEEDESAETTNIEIETTQRNESGEPTHQVFSDGMKFESHYAYDDQRVVSAERFSTEDGEKTNHYEFGYDELGRLRQMERGDDLDDGEPEVTITYEYDGDGRLEQLVREDHRPVPEMIGADEEREPIVLSYVYDCGE